MAMASAKTQCSLCDEEKETYTCRGCSETFCFRHLTEHRETISKQFYQSEDHCNSFREKLNHQKNNVKERPLIGEIDKWEEDSIYKIKQTAEKCRQRLIDYINEFLIEIENTLNDLTEQLKQICKENKFNEIDLNQSKEKLKKLQEELDKPPNVSIEQELTSFINKISVVTPFGKDTKWKQLGITVAGGNGEGNQLDQLYYPHGIFIDDNQTLYIADWRNHRIVEWKSNATNGQIVAGGNGPGSRTNQLDRPTDVIFDKENNCFIIADWRSSRVMRWYRQNNTNGQIIISDISCYGLAMDEKGDLYVSDPEKNEVTRWKIGEKNGTIVAGGNGRGNHLNQLSFPTYIFVDKDYSLYVLDKDNHRVIKWLKDAKEGIIVVGGNGQGNSLRQLSSPHGMIVDQRGQIYVADSHNHRVIRCCKGTKEGTIIVGGNGTGQEANQLSYPRSLSFDQQGNLYVADQSNHRIQKFEIDETENN